LPFEWNSFRVDFFSLKKKRKIFFNTFAFWNSLYWHKAKTRVFCLQVANWSNHVCKLKNCHFSEGALHIIIKTIHTLTYKLKNQ
jgi:hypothetical protein